MTTQLSEKWAKINVVVIGMFYLISGMGEYLMSEILGEGLGGRAKGLFFLGPYQNYLTILGVVTFFLGVGLLFRINLARILALILAWWNLFTSPLFHIWWSIYTGFIKKVSNVDLSISGVVFTLILLSVMTIIRFYIIYVLKTSKAGYVFFRDKMKN